MFYYFFFIFLKKELNLKIPILFLKKNLLKKQIHISFVVIVLSLFYLNGLDLLSNMKKLKFFTFLDYMVFLTFFLWISVTLEVLFFDLKIHRNISDSFLIESFHFINMSNSISTKLYYLLSV